MADSKAKNSGKRRTNPAKRNAQNIRTFQHVQKRRTKHARAHGVKADGQDAFIGATRWTTVPTTKAQATLVSGKKK